MVALLAVTIMSTHGGRGLIGTMPADMNGHEVGDEMNFVSVAPNPATQVKVLEVQEVIRIEPPYGIPDLPPNEATPAGHPVHRSPMWHGWFARTKPRTATSLDPYGGILSP